MAFLLLIIIPSFSLAEVGISPPLQKITFKPNLEQQISFKVYGYHDVEFESTCPDWITVNRQEVVGEGGTFEVYPRIILPERITPPGKHTCRLIIREPRNEGSPGIISAVAQVASTIIIDVPYPGRYAEIDLVADNVNKGEPLEAVVNIKNQGMETLYNLQVKIVIKDFLNRTVGTFYTDTTTLGSKESLGLKKTIDTRPYEVGKYRVSASLEYGGNSTAFDSENVIIGKKYVDLISITNSSIGNVIKFYLDIESWWGNDIMNVHADVLIYNETQSESFRTVSTPLRPWERLKLYGFLAEHKLGPGVYNADITLVYDGESSEFTRLVEIYAPEESGTGITGLMVLKQAVTSPWIIVVILAIVIVADIMWLRRRRHEK